jgi:TonB family protein
VSRSVFYPATSRFRGERGVLLAALIASLLAHVLAFWMFRVSVGKLPAATGPRTHVYFSAPLGPTRAALTPKLELTHAIAETLDPSLLSLPSPHGFSGDLIRKEMPPLIGKWTWKDEPVFLIAPLETALRAWLEQLKDWSPLLQEKPVPEPLELLVETPLFPLPPQSAYEISGDLSGRTVIRAEKLPAIRVEHPLRRSIVRVAVSDDGLVRYVVLEQSSGSAEADEIAKKFAQRMRFEPLDSANGALQWGWVQCLWAVEIPATEAEQPAANAQ